jgi:GWxTD domain-containing protein
LVIFGISLNETAGYFTLSPYSLRQLSSIRLNLFSLSFLMNDTLLIVFRRAPICISLLIAFVATVAVRADTGDYPKPSRNVNNFETAIDANTKKRVNSLCKELDQKTLLFVCHGKSQDAPTTVPWNPWRDPHVSERYKKWLKEEVVWIVTDRERKEFRNLTSDQQRDEYIAAFWERRNPTPGSAHNSFKQEHYRRITYANEHFSTGLEPLPGWVTDRGRVYILYGPPDSVELHPGFSPPIEIWRYAFLEGCTNAVLTFTDKTGGGDYILNHADVDWLRQMRATGK